MSDIKNLDLLLSRKTPLSMSEFQKVVADGQVATVVSLESDKKFHLRYEVKLLNNKVFSVYVKMSLKQIIALTAKQK